MRLVALAIAVFVFPLFTHASLLDDVGEDASTPVTTPARNVVLIGGGLALTAAVFEDSISDPVQREATEGRPLGHFATQMGTIASPMLPNLVYAIGMATYAWAAGSAVANEHAVVMTKASICSVAVTGHSQISDSRASARWLRPLFVSIRSYHRRLCLRFGRSGGTRMGYRISCLCLGGRRWLRPHE